MHQTWGVKNAPCSSCKQLSLFSSPCLPFLRCYPRSFAPLPTRASSRGQNQHDAPQQPETSPSLPKPTPTTATLTIALALATAAASPPSCQASSWQPRRHHRPMKDEVIENAAKMVNRRLKELRQQASALDALQRQQTQKQGQQGGLSSSEWSALLKESSKSIKKSYHKIAKSLNLPTKSNERQQQEQQLYSVGVSSLRPDVTSPSSTTSSFLGWWVVCIAVVGAVYAVWAKALGSGRSRRAQGGRWVRDRSLGGKLIFIPDISSSDSSSDSSYTRNSKQPKATSARPLWEDDEQFSRGVVDYKNTLSSAKTAQEMAKEVEAPCPVWWAPPAPVRYVTASVKEGRTKEAKAAIRGLEDAKLRGEAYSLSSFVALRRACHEGGGVQVRVGTENGRDALFRGALKLVIQALAPSPASSLPVTSSLGGFEPGRFMSGLACDVSMPESRAVTIVHGEVAAASRAALIDAEAAYRAGDQTRLLGALRTLVAVVDAFPLPVGSPEAEMVGRTIQSQTTLEFRRSVFLAAGSVNLSIAPIIAEMMGFNPDQVMEQLKAQLSMYNNKSDNVEETTPSPLLPE